MICIIHFYDEWVDFRLQELDALLKLHGLPPLNQLVLPETSSGCYLIVDLPGNTSVVVKSICSRSVLIKCILELWEYGSTLDEVIDKLRQSQLLKNESSSNYHSFFADKAAKWSFQIDPYCKTLSIEQKEMIRQRFQFLGFQGQVKISSPDVEYRLLLNFESGKSDEFTPNQSVPTYFGRTLATGGMREELKKYDLKKRIYLGPTSLDHALAFLMANLALVRKGMIALDPFVGTGSILVAMGHFGARCIGTDIDTRVLQGDMYAGNGDRSVKRGIFQNFAAYNLEPPDLIRMDNHLFHRHTAISIEDGFFDVIVTDPPYGIRAGARKSGVKGGYSNIVPEEKREGYQPGTQNYGQEEVMLDLLNTAARSLVLKGRLAYLIPTTYDFTIDDLPKHPCLEIVSICEQPLSTRHGRRCVVMEKAHRCTENLLEEFRVYKELVLAGKDNGFGKLSLKLERALASNPLDTDDGVVKHVSKSAMKRKQSRVRRVESILKLQKENANTTTITADQGTYFMDQNDNLDG